MPLCLTRHRKPSLFGCLFSAWTCKRPAWPKPGRNLWGNENETESCQEKCIQERAGGTAFERGRRTIALVPCRHWGLPVVAGVLEEGERPQLVSDFQKDSSTSWSCHCANQMRALRSGRVSRDLSGRRQWGNRQHDIRIFGQLLHLFGDRLAAYCTGSKARAAESSCQPLSITKLH